MKQYAYIRVSSKDQNIDRQIAALEPYHIPSKQIYCDYQSGKDFERPSYNKLVKKLRKGDLLIIKSIDRLGRNYDEILEQWSMITKKMGVNILVLDMPLLDTRERNGDLTGAFIADLVLQILAYVAQTEREFIHERQLEGIAAAKAQGVKLGRHPVTLPERFDEICYLHEKGQLSIRKAAETLGMSKTTFHRKYKIHYCSGNQDNKEQEQTMNTTGADKEVASIKNSSFFSKNNIPKGRLYGTPSISTIHSYKCWVLCFPFTVSPITIILSHPSLKVCFAGHLLFTKTFLQYLRKKKTVKKWQMP